MASTDTLLAKQMNSLLKGTTFTPPSTLYIALYTTPPNISGTGGVEVSLSSTGYARVAVPSNSSNWVGPDSNMSYQTVNEVVFGVPVANWGTVTAVGLLTAAVGGELYFVGNLITPRTIGAGEGAPKFAAGNLKFSPVR
jgi:hypothetical protein